MSGTGAGDTTTAGTETRRAHPAPVRTAGKPGWVAPVPRAARLHTSRAQDIARRQHRRPGIHALDGLRAIAVALVLANHGGVPGVAGGFIGVDLFFVLSGFLITSLLLDEFGRTGRIDQAGFWIRRGRRLLPALLLMVAAVVAVRELFSPEAVAGLREDAVAAFFWVANWRSVFEETDYFTQGGTPSPLQHVWSLGVEEQYYVVWPLVLIAVALGLALRARRRGRPAATLGGVRLAAVAVATAGAVASAVAAVALASDDTRNRVYFGTDTRAQALLTGAAAAALVVGDWPALTSGWSVIRTRWGRWVVRLLPPAGLAVLAGAVHWATGSADEFRHGLLSVVALASIAVIAPVALYQDGMIARALAWRPLAWLGGISYGIYLWHWPVFLVLNGERTGWSGWSLFAARCTATVAVAFVSWWAIEEPIRRWRPVSVPMLPLVGATVVSAVAVTVLVVPVGTGAGANTSGLPPEVTAAAAVSPSPPDRQTAAHPAAGHDPNRPRTVSVFGDSIAWTLMHHLPPTPGYDFIDHTIIGCSTVRSGPYRYSGETLDQKPECDAWPNRWTQQVALDQPDVSLLVVGRWETVDRVNEGRWTHIGDPTFDAYLAAELRRALDVLGSTGSRIAVTTLPYSRYGERPDGSLYPEDDPQRVDRWNALLRRVAGHRPNVTLVDLRTQLSPDGVYTPDIDGIKVRSDGVHLTEEGVAWLTPWLMKALR